MNDLSTFNQNELAEKIVIHLIQNGVHPLDIDQIMLRVIKINDKQKLRRALLDHHDTCELCGCKKKVELHHINPKRDYPDLEFDINNLMVLCRDCHDIVHNRRNKIFYNAEPYRKRLNESMIGKINIKIGE